MIMEGTRPPTGASPTQPFNAVSMLKSKSKQNHPVEATVPGCPPRSAIPAFSGDRDGRPYNTAPPRSAVLILTF